MEKIGLTFIYETITVPATTVDVTYTVTADGKIGVNVHYHGKAGLPELPVFGMRFIMPTKADGYAYDGSMHMDTEAVTVYRSSTLNNVDLQSGKNIEKTGLTFRSAGEKFAFSCLPYTAEELENATHQEELPPERRTVLCICGAVRGVGGIDSWGSDVEEGYHIDAEKDIEFGFEIE